MQYVYLISAILSEVAGTTALKLSDGFSKPIASLAVLLFYGLGFYFFAQSLKQFGVGTAYALWSGLGTALVALIGVIVFHESLTAAKVASILLIIIGSVGLNLGGSH